MSTEFHEIIIPIKFSNYIVVRDLFLQLDVSVNLQGVHSVNGRLLLFIYFCCMFFYEKNNDDVSLKSCIGITFSS